ncbi:AraC-type DNA-binding protein [Hymenobacter gelipurpurascens]|uniref:AraC-type DNA-binding protein n=1 Tax=Hymenobacter gelipurpurascens TaxID=89968 RepID=A0A212T596_9BACT|nr:AraC family transcriptional regulator [Hymenobacter gelipurpurascens]SNC61040.1 AraC-type DNA-binding protein [Hymenobacter gelipurpurascens]
MLVHVDLAVAFQLFCLVQGLTTGAYLLIAKPRLAANRWLALLLLGLTLQVADYFLSRSGVYFRNRWLYFTPLFFSWSFGPLLLNYLLARCNRPPLRWPHFVPVALQLLFYVVVAAQSFDTKTWFWLTVHKPYTRYLEHYGAVLSVLVYARLAWRLVSTHGGHPRWLGWALPGLGVFYVLAALDPFINRYYLPPGAPTFYLTGLVLPLLAYALALIGWLQNRSLTAHLTSSELLTATVSSASAASVPLPDPEHLRCLVAALEQDHLYRNPDLTLDVLAQHLGLTSNMVSQLLNAGLGQSFHDVVNGYRLEEVKRRLLTPDVQRLTVLALALEAGFNSKTTFNRVFKEKTGCTPKDYQKKYHPTLRDDSVSAQT